jgi:hypothetical protein
LIFVVFVVDDDAVVVIVVDDDAVVVIVVVDVANESNNRGRRNTRLMF